MVTRWKRLTVKLINHPTLKDAIQHLDVVTGMRQSEAMKSEAAFGRWVGSLERMYKVNGTLEF